MSPWDPSLESATDSPNALPALWALHGFQTVMYFHFSFFFHCWEHIRKDCMFPKLLFSSRKIKAEVDLNNLFAFKIQKYSRTAVISVLWRGTVLETCPADNQLMIGKKKKKRWSVFRLLALWLSNEELWTQTCTYAQIPPHCPRQMIIKINSFNSCDWWYKDSFKCVPWKFRYLLLWLPQHLQIF